MQSVQKAEYNLVNQLFVVFNLQENVPGNLETGRLNNCTDYFHLQITIQSKSNMKLTTTMLHGLLISYLLDNAYTQRCPDALYVTPQWKMLRSENLKSPH